MTQDELTPEQAKLIQKQIALDQAQPLKPAEKRQKIDNSKGFTDTIQILSQQQHAQQKESR
jgi:hypothetical protein